MNNFFKFIFARKVFLLPFIFTTFAVYLVTAKIPIHQAFEFDSDEGSTLIKAQLYSHGFRLYKEIWDDQPPLLTVGLSYYFNLFKPSIYYARILILISSCILLLALFSIITRLNGAFCALIAAIFLILSTQYLQLSLSVMPAIPSLAFAMLSIYCVARYRGFDISTPLEPSKLTPHYNESYLSLFLLLSGVFMAISLGIKLITAFLIPAIFLEIIVPNYKNSTGHKQKSEPPAGIIFWLAGFITTVVVITIIFFQFNINLLFHQLFLSHQPLLPLKKYNFIIISRMLFTDYDIALLALIQIIIIAQTKKKQFRLPTLWLMIIFLIFLIHKPLWHHYYPLIAIPLCWLAAIRFKSFISAFLYPNQKHKKNLLYWLTAGFIILTILRIPVKYHRMIESVTNETTSEEHKILNLLAAHKRNTRWLITDRPIFAFYSGILVPPELALISNKRIFAPHFTENYIFKLMEKYKPEQILLTRFKIYEDKLQPCLSLDYTKIYQGKLFNSVWMPLNLLWRDKQPFVMGGRSYKSAGKDIKLYLRNTIKQ